MAVLHMSDPARWERLVDGRRAHAKSFRRERIEALLDKAQLLPNGERELVHQVFELGIPVATIARIRRVPARRLQRRLQAVLRRFKDPLYVYLLQNGELLPPLPRRVATACIAQGQSLRAAARTLDLSLHTVRQNLAVARTLASRAA